ncbi:hypothetical protein JW826_02860 [Candidatus Woesearchaeota archaeon]|nr:hypothetical protein [Candidatus Woesearchaeota archaeon]
MRRGAEAKASIWKRTIMPALALALLLALAYVATPVSFTTNPYVSPNSTERPDTTDDLTCSWNASTGTTSQNVTWYNGSVQYLNDTGISGLSSLLGSSSTARGEVWTCQVFLGNGTETINLSSNVTIKNAPPTTPTMTNDTGSSVTNITQVYEDIANNFTLSSTDPDSDSVIYGYFGSLPSGSSLDSGTGVFTWTPTYTSTTQNITLYATDNYGGSPGVSTKKVQFNVTYMNDAPDFTLANQTMNEGEIFNYPITATDEEDNQPFNFSISIDPTLNLIINQTSNTSATMMFAGNSTASFFDAGNYTVTVNVSDTLNATRSRTFILEILPVNMAPTLQFIPMYNATQGSSLVFNVTANDSDANATLNFSTIIIGCQYSGIWNITTTNNSQNATGLVNITTLTNEHVVCRTVRFIVVDDKGAEDSQDVFLNISNTNDPPIVHVLSSYYNNTAGQQNISNLTAYVSAEFTYLVNATDPDELTYEGEVLSFSDDSGLFVTNSITGLVQFTPSASDVGNHTINITVTDDGGLFDTEMMNLTVINNSAPILNPIGTITCFEDVLCTEWVSASDADNEDLTFSSNNTAVFDLTDNSTQTPVASAYANYTPDQSLVGNYSLLVTVTDTKGAIDNETITVIINNTNDAPSVVDFTFPKIVETHTVSFSIDANDDDYLLIPSYEYVNFSVINISGSLLFNITTAWNSATNKSHGQVLFVPELGTAGNYSINITATDYYGATHTINKNFTVIAKSNAPNITQVYPYGTPLNSIIVFAFANRSLFPNNSTGITFPENTTINFTLNLTDETPVTNLTFLWYVDGTLALNTTNQTNYTRSYGFFSEGSETVSVRVEDDYFENASFTWSGTTTDVNRAPALINALRNISANGTTVYNEYLMRSYLGTHYIDPDDDNNSNNVFDEGETSLLTYTVTSCNVATLTIESHTLRVRPTSIGNCTVTFTATDPESLTLESNAVFIEALQISNETTVVETPQPQSGGGGSSRNSPIPIPITKEDIKPQAIEIVVPEIVTVYENKTVVIPIGIQNTWNSTLTGVRLNVSALPPEIDFQFSEDYFDEIKRGEVRNVTLSVTNYRLGDDYKIQIMANVTEPETGDSAYVFLNTIEQSQTGKDIQTKVTFAQDLLNENPECLELNELLTKAKEELANGGSNEEAINIVDGVIEGCKYLVSVSKRTVQKPETIVSKVIRKENQRYLFAFLGAAAIGTIILLTGKRRKAARKKQEEENAKKAKAEDEDWIKPYWPGS